MKPASKSGCGKFCVLPWVHRFTNVGGEIQVCCTSEEMDNNIYAEDGGPMNILEGRSDEEIMNSKYMKNLRKQLLDGEWPEICRRCEITETTGGISRRMDENAHFEHLVPQLMETTAADGEIKVDVKSSDYRLGNLCNLACRMCGPRSSTPWLKYSVAMVDSGIQPFTKEQWKEFSGYNWTESPQFINHIREQMPTLEHLHFAGGEPLINPEMGKLLKYCVEQGHSKHICLTYNTNLTRIPAEVKALWPHFAAVHLYISVDAYGPLNDFIRHPAKWREIDANLRDIDENFVKYGIQLAAIMTTVQIYNIFQLEDLYDYLFNNMKNVMKLPKLIDLYSPTPLRTQVLPAKLKSLARSRLQRILKISEERLAQGLISRAEAGTLDTLRSSIVFLDLENREFEFDQFWVYSDELDRLHKKNTREFVPELNETFAPAEL